MQITILGIDLGKNSCSVVGLDDGGRVVVRRRMHRASVIKFAGSLMPCVVAMEACCGAHHLGRLLRAQGHEIRLMSPEYVRPYVKAQKNDERDAEAIAEAATRPTMRFVELKAEEQLDMQTLHRVRDRLVGERTALLNQLRAVLLERGTVFHKADASSNSILTPCWAPRTGRAWLHGCAVCSRTCGRSGRPSTGGLRHLTRSSLSGRGRTRTPAG